MEHMDWYLKYESDDLLVPNDREALDALCLGDISSSQIDWSHWGLTGSEKFRSPNKCREKSTKPSVEEFNFDRQSQHDQVSKESSVSEAEGSNSSTYPDSSVDYCSERTSFYGLADFQLQKSMDWMDEAFLSTLLEEDNRNMGNQLASLTMPDSIERSQSFGNLMRNELLNPQGLMKDMATRETSMPTCRFTDNISEAWGKVEAGSSSCLMPDEYDRSEGSAMNLDHPLLVPVELRASNESEAISDVDEPKCSGESVLQVLEDTMTQLSERTRICFRDALYRLAKTSKQRPITQNRSVNFINRPLFADVNGEIPSLGRTGCAESETNTIDRTIANLMFNLPHYCSPDLPIPGSLQWRIENFASHDPRPSDRHYQGQANYLDASSCQFA